MQEVRFHLEVFEGPLQLLLHLIEKNKINIADIPISLILEQYMEYVKAYEELDVEQLSEFVAMASQLLFIKSRMLLPQPEDEEEDPREDLVRLLEQYKRYKELAKLLGERYRKGSRCFVREPEDRENARTRTAVQPLALLTEAFERVTTRKPEAREPQALQRFARMLSTHVVPVGARIVSVLRRLHRAGQARFLALFSDSRSRSELVATFLAVLELARSQRIRIEDGKNDYDVILVTGGKHGDKRV